MTVNIDSLTDFHSGRQHRSIYADPKIYELEQERIFGRCWLFLAHEQHFTCSYCFAVNHNSVNIGTT